VTFLNPAWLLLALAAAIPIAIHLLRRRIGTRVELPTARYLARAEAEHSRELRLRNILLMLLRAGAIVLIAVAAARPFAPVPGGARAPGAIAIVVDNTMSSAAVSGGVPVFDELRTAARVPLERLAPADRAWLITADGAVRSGAGEALLARLDSIRPIAGRGDLPRALTLADAAVQGSGLPGEIALVTDAQSSQWDEPLAFPRARLAIYAPASAPPSNRAVVEATPEPLRWTGGSGAVHIAFLSADSALYRVTIAGETLLRGVAEPDGRVRAPVVTTLRGWFAGTVETERDELPLDDVRHFAAFAGALPAVAVGSGAGMYAATAVATLADRGRVSRGTQIHVLPADTGIQLPALIAAPLDPVRAGAANRALERAGIPWRYGDRTFDSTTARADSAVFGGALPPEVFVRYRLMSLAIDTASAIDTLASVDGEPWMVAGDGYVLLASALDPAHSTLPVSAAFIPWLERMLAHRLTSDAIGVIEALTGDTIRLPPWADGVEAAAPAARRRVAFDVPGVHFLTRNGVRAGAIVVNPPRRESMLERITVETLRQRFTAAAVTATSDMRAFDRALLSTRGRREITGWILLLAGALIVAEMIVRGLQGRTPRPDGLSTSGRRPPVSGG
jgi:hypothetical protein